MTIQELSKQIDDQNLSFRKANKARKRVMIAKDTIARVVAQQLVVEADNAIIDDINVPFGSLKDALCIDDEFCKVCAKGALFMSYVGRVNKVNIEDIHPDSFEHRSNNNPIVNKLTNIFSEEQLALMEAAFEGKQITHYLSDYVTFIDLGGFDYRTFHHNYYKDDDRLIAICQNIIKNKGTFVL